MGITHRTEAVWCSKVCRVLPVSMSNSFAVLSWDAVREASDGGQIGVRWGSDRCQMGVRWVSWDAVRSVSLGSICITRTQSVSYWRGLQGLVDRTIWKVSMKVSMMPA